MADSCSHWWHAPFYLALSVTLAFIAISTGIRSGNPQSKLSLQQSLHHNLSINASRALRLRGGFTVFAALLQISPDLFLSSPDSTIFAVQDPAFFNVSLPPWAIKELLLYHTSPSRLPFNLLLRIPVGNCVSTLLLDKNAKITKIDPHRRSVEINNVLITHPDLFLGNGLSVHGVAGFFSPAGKEIVQSSPWDSNTSQLEWPRIVQLLSSNGFVSFAIGLYSVLDGLTGDHSNLTFVTIFALPSLGFLSSPSPLLNKVVKLHLVPSKYTYQELSSLPQGTVLNTLLPCAEVKISFNNSTRSLFVNGVEITAPDVLRSRNFTVHGISRALGVYNQVQNQIV